MVTVTKNGNHRFIRRIYDKEKERLGTIILYIYHIYRKKGKRQRRALVPVDIDLAL